MFQVSKTNMHGYKIHSFVGNTDNTVALCTLKEIESTQSLVDTQCLTFPDNVNPRALFHLLQASPRVIVPIIYDWSTEVNALKNNLYSPFGAEYPVDQEMFTAVSEASLTQDERLVCLAHISENYAEYLAESKIGFYGHYGTGSFLSVESVKDYIEKGTPLPLNCDTFRICYFECKKPFIFYSKDPMQAVMMNYSVANTMINNKKRNYQLDGVVNQDAYKKAVAEGEPERTMLLRTMLNNPVIYLGSKFDYPGTDDSQFSNSEYDFNADFTSSIYPVAISNGREIAFSHSSTTMLPGRSVMYSSVISRNATGAAVSFMANSQVYGVKDNARYFSEALDKEVPFEVGAWVLWAPLKSVGSGMIYGKEISRYKSIYNTVFRRIASQNPSVAPGAIGAPVMNPMLLPYKGGLSGFYSNMSDTPDTGVGLASLDVEQPTEIFSIMNESTPIEQVCDYMFYGTVIKDRVMYDSYLRPIDSLFDLNSVRNMAEEDVVCDVCTTFGNGYLQTTALPSFQSQVQLAYSMSMLGVAVPVGYVTAHPGVSESQTLPELVAYHKNYGLTHYSRKDKSQLFRDIEETAHEMARPSLAEYAESKAPEEQAKISVTQVLGMVSKVLLADPASGKGATVFGAALTSIGAARGGTKAVNRTGRRTPEMQKTWIGGLAYRGSEFLKDGGSEANVSAGWKVNLGLLGRTRGSSIVNPNTIPLILMNSSTAYEYYTLPTLPSTIEPYNSENLDSVIYAAMESRLWAEA